LREDPAHDIGEAAPILRIARQLLPAAAGDGVVLGLAVVVRGAPRGGDPAAVLQTDERGVDGALVEQDGVARDLLNAARDAVAVLLTHGRESLQHHEIEGSLKQIEFGVGHFLGSPVYGPHEYTKLLWECHMGVYAHAGGAVPVIAFFLERSSGEVRPLTTDGVVGAGRLPG
jgi:hypothetical protein